MEKSTDLLKKMAVTLDKYKKNKTLVSPEDLAGKYKVPFENLKNQLKKELSEYLKTYSLEDLELREGDELREFVAAAERIFKTTDLGKRAGRAAFQEFDITKVKQCAEELRIRIHNEAWIPYFQKFTCLYVLPECLVPENPQTPQIYNSLVDKFWDEDIKEWISDNDVKNPAALIYFQEGQQ